MVTGVAGIARVLLPDWNRNDVQEIPETHRKGPEFVFIKTVDDVLEHAFGSGPKGPAPPEAPGRATRPEGAPAAQARRRGR